MRSLVLVITSIALMRVAGASPESDQLFHDGKDLLKAGKLAEACEAFARSQKLAPKVGTLLNLADCRERQGQTATAWSLFRDAKELASQTKDKREKEATARVASLEPKLAYITVKIAAERQVPGLVVKRNGFVVEPSAWNQPVPLDPGDYAIEASAPKYTAWSTKQQLGPRERADVAVELVAEPATVAVVPPDPNKPAVETSVASGPPDRATPPPVLHTGPVPPVRPFGFGVTVGWRADTDDVLVGGRILGDLAVPGGALRGGASLIYTNTQLARFNDLTDSTNNTSIYEMGLSVDYVWMPVPQFAFAGGVGAGIDYFSVSLDQPSATDRWGALRASPIIARLAAGHVELGLHLQMISNGSDVVFLGVAAIDVFPL